MQYQACTYCAHPNLAGTNYCNDCGAALHLRPCRRCGAVTVATAVACPACSVEFAQQPVPTSSPQRSGVGLLAPDSSPPAASRSIGTPRVPGDTKSDIKWTSFESLLIREQRPSDFVKALTQTRIGIEKGNIGTSPKAPPNAQSGARYSVDDSGVTLQELEHEGMRFNGRPLGRYQNESEIEPIRAVPAREAAPDESDKEVEGVATFASFTPERAGRHKQTKVLLGLVASGATVALLALAQFGDDDLAFGRLMGIQSAPSVPPPTGAAAAKLAEADQHPVDRSGTSAPTRLLELPAPVKVSSDVPLDGKAPTVGEGLPLAKLTAPATQGAAAAVPGRPAPGPGEPPASPTASDKSSAVPQNPGMSAANGLPLPESPRIEVPAAVTNAPAPPPAAVAAAPATATATATPATSPAPVVVSDAPATQVPIPPAAGSVPAPTAPPAVPLAATGQPPVGGCPPEIQVLNLCGKVSQRP